LRVVPYVLLLEGRPEGRPLPTPAWTADPSEQRTIEHRSCIGSAVMERLFIDWLVRYGAPILFVAQVFGIFGLPIPDELLLTMAGALVARGVLDAPSTVTAAVAGCLTGITMSYAVGRVVGITVLRATFERHLDQLERAQALFRRFGGWLLAFGYFVPGVRHVTAIAAGSGILSYPAFARFAYPGGVLWCAVFLALGYYGGDRWPVVARSAKSHLALAGAVAISMIAAYAIVTLRRRSQRRA
jgi:membrane protein DedA with SNARE-associated domain